MYDYDNYEYGLPWGGFFLTIAACVAIIVGIFFLTGCGDDSKAKAADTPWPPSGVTHDGNVFYVDPKLDRIISYQDLCTKYFNNEAGSEYNQVQSIQYPQETHRGDIVMICHYEGGN